MQRTIIRRGLIPIALLLVSSLNGGALGQVFQLEGSPTIDYMLIDPSGKRAGFDPFLRQAYGELGPSNYAWMSVGQIPDSGLAAARYSKELITNSGYSPSTGTYRIRIMGTKQGSYTLELFVDPHPDMARKGLIAPGQIRYYGFTYNPDTTIQITLDSLTSTSSVKGGIFKSSGTSTLSVWAKSSISFGAGDTLRSLTATLRWQGRYNLTLGSVSSPVYGFVKVDSVITIGAYKYQKFRSALQVSLNWAANSENELFTVPVGGSAGVVDFELTNALAGGEWFVDVNYSDRTDTTFYQRVATCIVLSP